jgi:hypothetical protein
MFVVRSRADGSNGALSVVASELREALNLAADMVERGVQNVEILDENGVALDLVELERTVASPDEAQIRGDLEAGA